MSSQRTIRVFLSSTFRDMHAERDHLSRKVFPVLRDRCRRRGAEFVAVDLRWGVTKDEAENGQVLDICLKEIEQSRPFFVGLLGDRFGWVPPPDVVATDIFERVAGDPTLSADDKARLERWYGRDAFSDPPVYRLVRDPKVPIPDADADALVRLWTEAGVPYAGESITAREILRGVFDEGFPPTHALFYLRRSGIHEAEGFPPKLVRVFVETDAGRQAQLAALKARIRGRAGDCVVQDYEVSYDGLHIEPAQLPPDLSVDERKALADGRIQSHEWQVLSDAVRAAVEQHGTVALGEPGVLAFGEMVLEDLWEAIRLELPEDAAPPDAHAVERAYHERFIADRTQLLVGRQAEFDRLLTYLSSDEGDPSQAPMVVTGPPGSGKSAVMARLVELARERFPDALVIPHFIGASPGSQLLTTTVRAICETLRRSFGIEEPLPDDPDELRFLLPRYLEQVSAASAGARQVFLVLDALNQLDPTGRSHELGWFPWWLPAGVKVVASTLPGSILDRLLERLSDAHVLTVAGLSQDDRRDLVTAFLAERRKKLEPSWLDALLEVRERPDGVLPLYLRVALEELCLYGDFWTLEKRIASLPATIPELFTQVLERLETDHTPEVPAAICAWLAASRSGLLESEVLGLLDTRWPGFAPARWVNFYHAVAPYLKPRGEATEVAGGEGLDEGLIDFYHDQLRFAVYERYLKVPAAPLDPDIPPCERPAEYQAPHRELAAYYHSTAFRDGNPPTWHTEHPRGLGELPFHQAGGCLQVDLHATLTDFRFLEAKVTVFGAQSTIVDLGLTDHPMVRLLRDVLQREAHLIAREPRLLAPHIHNMVSMIDSGHAHANSLLLCARESLADRAWLCLINRPQAMANWNALYETIELNKRKTQQLDWILDGTVLAIAAERAYDLWEDSITIRFGGKGISVQALTIQLHDVRERQTIATIAEECTCLAWSSREGILAAAIEDGTIRLWDRSGALSMVIHGHRDTFTDDGAPVSGPVSHMAWSPDERVLASAGIDGSIQLWRAIMPANPLILRAHEDRVKCLAWSPDGTLVASTGEDGLVRLWKVADGSMHAELRHAKSVSHLAWAPDSAALATADGGHVIRLWDTRSCDCYRVIDVGKSGHGQIPWSPRGDNLAVSTRGYVRLFDAKTGHYRSVLDAHAGSLSKLCWSPNGTLLACTNADGIVFVWDINSDDDAIRLMRHTDRVTSLAWSPDGSILASGSEDRTVRLWQPSMAVPGAALDGHSGRIQHVIWSPDGCALASGSDDTSVRIWNAEAATCKHVLELPPTARRRVGRVSTIAWSPDGTTLASTNAAEGFDFPGQLIFLWESDGVSRGVIDGHTDEVLAISWSPDARFLASASSDKSVRVWDPCTGRCERILKGHADIVVSLAWSPNGTLLASGDTNGLVIIWDVRRGRSKRLRGHEGWILNLSWSQDGACLASASDRDGGLRIWTLDGTLRASVQFNPEPTERHVPGMFSLTFSPTGHKHQTISRLDSRYDKLGQQGVLLEWSPDGTWLAVGGNDGVIRLWNARGEAGPTLLGHSGIISSLAWSPNASYLASGGVDNTVRLWHVALRACVTQAYTLATVVALKFSDDGAVLRVADDGSATRFHPIPYSFELSNLDHHATPRVESTTFCAKCHTRPGLSFVFYYGQRRRTSGGIIEEVAGKAEVFLCHECVNHEFRREVILRCRMIVLTLGYAVWALMALLTADHSLFRSAVLVLSGLFSLMVMIGLVVSWPSAAQLGFKERGEWLAMKIEVRTMHLQGFHVLWYSSAGARLMKSKGATDNSPSSSTHEGQPPASGGHNDAREGK